MSNNKNMEPVSKSEDMVTIENQTDNECTEKQIVVTTLKDPAELYELQSELTICVLCMESRQSTQLLPCLHKGICQQCLSMVEHERCPICRSKIRLVRLGGDKVVPMSELREVYKKMCAHDRLKTPQVTIVGSFFESKNEFKEMIESHFAENKTEETQFSPNCNFNGKRLRLSMTSWNSPCQEMVVELESLQPSVIILVYDSSQSAWALHQWYAFLRKSFHAPVLWALHHQESRELFIAQAGMEYIEMVKQIPSLYSRVTSIFGHPPLVTYERVTVPKIGEKINTKSIQELEKLFCLLFELCYKKEELISDNSGSLLCSEISNVLQIFERLDAPAILQEKGSTLF